MARTYQGQGLCCCHGISGSWPIPPGSMESVWVECMGRFVPTILSITARDAAGNPSMSEDCAGPVQPDQPWMDWWYGNSCAGYFDDPFPLRYFPDGLGGIYDADYHIWSVDLEFDPWTTPAADWPHCWWQPVLCIGKQAHTGSPSCDIFLWGISWAKGAWYGGDTMNSGPGGWSPHLPPDWDTISYDPLSLRFDTIYDMCSGHYTITE